MKRSLTRQEAIKDLSVLGIREPQIYLLDIIPLVEMMWADGELQQSELVILDEYVCKRVRQINDVAGYEVIDSEDAQTFARRFTMQKPLPEFLRMLRSLIGPSILSSSDSAYVDSVLKLMVEACLDIAANAVREYPYGLHDRFNPEEKNCFFEILKTIIDFKRPDGVKRK